VKKTTIVLWICLAVALHAAKIKTQAEGDPTFDFAAVHTWAWDPQGAGDVLLARTSTDDPAPVKARVDPLIQKYVEREMTARGLTPPTTGAPDIILRYYVIVTAGMNTQVMGQFLPATGEWGLPPFAAQTTALEIVTRGSLVLDAMRTAERLVVWRGIAQTEIGYDESDAVRDGRIRDAARELVKRLPRAKVKKKN
jgi:hypothetical protein